jgi:hypothetical protein
MAAAASPGDSATSDAPEGFEQARLSKSFDAELLKRDLDVVASKFRARSQPGPYHDGSWKGVALVNASGRADDDSPAPRPEAKPTEALAHAPYLATVLDSVGFPVTVARLLTLPPGAEIGAHRDDTGLSRGLLRLHMPVRTHELVDFRIGGQPCRWREGELWYGDFTQVHTVLNRSTVNRVHLVIDGEATPAALDLFPETFIAALRAQKVLAELPDHEPSADALRWACGGYKVAGKSVGLPVDAITLVEVANGRLAVSGFGPAIPLKAMSDRRFRIAGLGATVVIDFEGSGDFAERAFVRIHGRPEPIVVQRMANVSVMDRARIAVVQGGADRAINALTGLRYRTERARKRLRRILGTE